jgi:hypothetical protein
MTHQHATTISAKMPMEVSPGICLDCCCKVFVAKHLQNASVVILGRVKANGLQHS